MLHTRSHRKRVNTALANNKTTCTLYFTQAPITRQNRLSGGIREYF